ncbi:MAG: 3-deoxy-D-manno-octulosonic acid transferase [Phycisphaerae bacterium]|nr:3-deoxy-D-manno-octulosonic acid transferase [Phycisphaerae bacterium]
MTKLLAKLLYKAFLPVGAVFAFQRRRKRDPAGFDWREYLLGRVPPRPVSANCVWIHGVSLGEINATRTIIEELRRRTPHTVVVVSSTTETGLARARELYPRLVVFQFPLDFTFAVREVLHRVRPSVIALMELELWPNLIDEATAYGVPILVVNGRVTERSVQRFRYPLAHRLSRHMCSLLTWVGAQDATYASRFIELGVRADRVEITGSVKYDAADTSDRIAGQEELADAMGIKTDEPLWVCGSTGPGEEEAILEAYQRLLKDHANLQLAIIPRKPERFDEVAQLIVRHGYACLRRSSGAPVMPEGVDEPRPVFLGDTMGELRKFYSLATVVFVGRTLVPMGGSDVMEVAGLAKPIIVGPHTENFAEPVNMLLAEGALRQISAPGALATVVSDLLRHPERREQMGRAGREAILSRAGASRKVVDRILEYLM